MRRLWEGSSSGGPCLIKLKISAHVPPHSDAMGFGPDYLQSAIEMRTASAQATSAEPSQGPAWTGSARLAMLRKAQSALMATVTPVDTA